MPLNINDDMPIGRPPSGKIGSRQQPAINAPDQLAEQGAAALAAPDTLASLSRPTLSAPDTLASLSRPTLSAPDTLASKPADLVAPPFPLNHARILWDNVLLGAVVTLESGTASNLGGMATANTYSRTYGVGPCVFQARITPVRFADSVALLFGGLRGVRVLLEIRGGDAVPYTVALDKVIGEANAVFETFSPRKTLKDLRISVFAADGQPWNIAVASAGEALQMQRPIFRGVDPAPLNRQTEYTNNVSDGGQWLGRDIIRQGLKTKPRWSELDPGWLRAYFDPFASAARRLTFFYSWNPQAYPDDVAYCWTAKDILPQITGPRDLMSVEIEMEGHA